jgi:hypothetical protein
MGQVSGIEDELTLLEDIVSLAIVDDLRGEETDAGTPVLLVVPGEEELRKRAAVLDGTKAVREIGPVLHGAELTFRVRIVVGDMGAAVSLGDTLIALIGKPLRFGLQRDNICALAS